MKNNRLTRSGITALTFTFVSLSLAWQAMASSVFIKVDDNEIGQGILRPRGTECLVITPAHVVENGFKIEVTTAEQLHAQAEVLELFPGDLSVLRIKGDNGISCKPISWPGHNALTNLLATEKQGELHTMLPDGSMRKSPVELVGYDPYRNIYVRPVNPADALVKGDSGSTLFVDGQVAGMLLSVDKNVGNVVRQDALTNDLALFFNDSNAPVASAAVAHHESPKPAATTSTASAGQQFSGSLYTNVTKEHQIYLQENSPVRIVLQPTGDKVKYAIELDDSTHRQSCSYSLNGAVTQDVTIPCTPQTTDNFTLRVVGTGGEGRYQMQVIPLVSDTTLRGDNNIIKIDGNPQSGTLARGAVAQYKVKFFANSPIRLVQQQTTEDYAYEMAIINSRGSSVFRAPSSARADGAQLRIPWTPPQTDSYTLQLTGRKGIGPYQISLQSIAFDSQLRGQANSLQIGGPEARGTIAKGAVAEYRFNVNALQQVRFNFASEDDLGQFVVEIRNAQGNIFFKDPYRSFGGMKSGALPFTVAQAGTYSLRLIGTEGETKYAISLTAEN